MHNGTFRHWTNGRRWRCHGWQCQTRHIMHPGTIHVVCCSSSRRRRRRLWRLLHRRWWVISHVRSRRRIRRLLLHGGRRRRRCLLLLLLHNSRRQVIGIWLQACHALLVGDTHVATSVRRIHHCPLRIVCWQSRRIGRRHAKGRGMHLGFETPVFGGIIVGFAQLDGRRPRLWRRRRGCITTVFRRIIIRFAQFNGRRARRRWWRAQRRRMHLGCKAAVFCRIVVGFAPMNGLGLWWTHAIG